VIHLIAELAENATVFSPPHTPVRIVGSVVVRGFAVEIEDRGLGMSQQKMAEINAAFLEPPQPDFPDSQQLGLYVATRLAQRHDIRVTLRSSPFGGTTAILLIPMKLIVTDVEDASQDRAAWSEGQPGEANSAPTGRHASRATAAQPQGGLPVGLNAGVNGHARHNGAEQRGADTPPDTGSWEVPDWMYGNGIGGDKPAAQPEPLAEPPVRPVPPVIPPTGPGWAVKSGRPAAGSDGVIDEFNLPRRVRQASIAPQLRETPSPETAGHNGKRGTERSPEELRDGLSALQRGSRLARGDNPPAGEPGAVAADGANQPPPDPPDPPETGGPHAAAT
jgi:Histidine kinase-, DNA gyrase B-, and HSP90-like ATPase